ncbi:hypothetical protein Q1695_007896 [Nippostrongylus brasiliensis]|nr:hypothetical protein Q1695_007896 [Nippostrongylus brasiliensis]
MRIASVLLRRTADVMRIAKSVLCRRNSVITLLIVGTFIFWIVVTVISQRTPTDDEDDNTTVDLVPETQPTIRVDFRSKVMEQSILTSKGVLSYDEVERNVFRPNNYFIAGRRSPLLKLDYINKSTCAEVFDEWLSIAQRKNSDIKPPRRIPSSMQDAFLLSGYAFLQNRYYNDKTDSSEVDWNPLMADLMRYPADQLTGYREQGLSMYHALRDYPLHNQVGFVVGSETPWVEIHALKSGARKVFTVEYQRILISEKYNISYIHPIDFASQWAKNRGTFDFAISFSSIEHSGLGRYGDILDPIGDLREVRKIRCLLKNKGLFFVAVPRGVDMILFNAHRFYGRMRLSMLMTGFEWLATYRGSTPHPVVPKQDDFENFGLNHQDLFVLQKT